VFLAPIELNWSWEDHHLTLSSGVFVPTGSYDAEGIKVGRNYWAVDSTVSYTWLDERRAMRSRPRQTSDDEGPVSGVSDAGGFRGEGLGLGPALLITPTVAGRDVDVVAKWLRDVHAVNRSRGDLVMLSVAFKVSP
jgi:hypothetical protein